MLRMIHGCSKITTSRSTPSLRGSGTPSSECRHSPTPPMAFTGPASNGNSLASFTSIDEPHVGFFAPQATPTPETPGFAAPQPSLLVFSGGTAFNSVASHVRHLTTRVTHVLPVSDDGGSTAEIVRVLGGPAVGDIRSRCLRLADDSDEEAQAVRHLLAYRLSSRSGEEAKREWYEIVEGNHKLWEGVSDPYKHTIRAFLVHFHVNILRHSTERFNFRSGSVGNFFFAGARIFFRSLEAAIFLFSRVARIPEGSLVLPAICTEERITLAAELVDGSVLVGQNEISHPAMCASPLAVDKQQPWEAFPSPVRRIFYLSSEGDRLEHEVAPLPNPRVIANIRSADAIIYGMGSLYTSVCPSLILRGVGEAVASRNCPKILLLNGGRDRETSSCAAHPGPMTATDVVLAITDALNRRGASLKSGRLGHAPSAYISAVLVPRGGGIEVDEAALHELGIQTIVQVMSIETADGSALYDPDALVDVIANVVEVQKEAVTPSSVQQDNKVSFFLQGAFGGEVEAATGEFLPSNTRDGSGEILYIGNHPAASSPLKTQDKRELIAWLEEIIAFSNNTMQQAPVEKKKRVANGKRTAAAQNGNKDEDMKDQTTSEETISEEDSSSSDTSSSSDSSASESETESEELEAVVGSGTTSRPATAAAAKIVTPKSDFRFVSFRDEVRGLSETGDPPRRMRHWLLRDAQGREHVAVDTTRWEQGKKRFTYQAVPPFSTVKPMICYNQRGVMEYLNQFVPPEVRVPIPEVAAGGSRVTVTTSAKIPASGSKKSNSGKKPPQTRNDYFLPFSAAGGGASGSRKPINQLLFIADTSRRNEAKKLRMATIADELARMKAECGVQYNLTLVNNEGEMEVLNSNVRSGGINGGAVGMMGQNGGYNSGGPSAKALALDFLTAAAAEEEQQQENKNKKKRHSDDNVGDGALYEQNHQNVENKRIRIIPPPDSDVAALCLSMENNTKMYLSGRWIRDPLPTHPLTETLQSFEVAADCGEALDKACLAEKLTVQLPNPEKGGPRITSDPPTESDVLIQVESLPDPVSGDDVELQSVWGLDSYTRTLLIDALKLVPDVESEEGRNELIDAHILPGLNALGDDGWDLMKAIKKVENKINMKEEFKIAAGRIATALEGLEVHCNDGRPVRAESRKHVRAHPKGEGVVVTRHGGLPAGTFLGEYLGELYTAWRWAEREQRKVGSGGTGASGNTSAHALRKAANRMGASPEYYNIVIERPKIDPRGYEILYIDAVQHGNFISRLSHSCSPNCRSVTVAVNGRLTVGVWTTRDVAVGEELTLDFAGETDVEREALGAVCLCGSALCRGSFLYLTPGGNSPLHAVAAAQLTLPDRCRMVLDAAADSHLNFEDSELFAKHGFKEILLRDGISAPPGNAGNYSGGGEEIPQWLKKWTAMVLGYVEAEAAELRGTLPGSRAPTGDPYTEQEANDEVDNQITNRLHALAVALNRAKLFLRHQPEELKSVAPLRAMNDAEIADYLWIGENSIARRVLATLTSQAEKLAAKNAGIGKRALRRGDRRPTALLPRWLTGVKTEDGEIDHSTYMNPSGANGGDTDAGGDYGGKNGAGQEEESSSAWEALAEEIETLVEKSTVTSADTARTALRKLATTLLSQGTAHVAMHDILQMYAATRTFSMHTEYASFTSELANGTKGTKYRPIFLWALLCGWYRSSDVLDQTLADRRGSVCLPDVECCYMPFFTEGKYSAPGGERAALLRHIIGYPKLPWPKAMTNFSFRNSTKVFGSPQMDVALRVDGDVALMGLIESLQAAGK